MIYILVWWIRVWDFVGFQLRGVIALNQRISSMVNLSDSTGYCEANCVVKIFLTSRQKESLSFDKFWSSFPLNFGDSSVQKWCKLKSAATLCCIIVGIFIVNPLRPNRMIYERDFHHQKHIQLLTTPSQFQCKKDITNYQFLQKKV
jgi:hypothetical protein